MVADAMADHDIIAADSISYSYPDGTCALRTVSCRFRAGEKTAVLGPNGAGKTTLFLNLNGLLRPSDGHILLHGKPVSYNRTILRQLRSAVQIVFQDPDTQLFAARVFQDVSYGALNLGLSRQEVEKRSSEAMRLMDIQHLRDKPTHFLSQGEKKRVAIAGALIMQPQVLIIDEPTAGVDPRHQQQLLGTLDRISSTGTAVILSTHDVELAWQWADRLIILHQGSLKRDDDPLKVFSDQALLEETGLIKPVLIEVFEILQKQGTLMGNPPKCRKALLELIKNNLVISKAEPTTDSGSQLSRG